MSIFQADPLYRLDAVQRAEDFAADTPCYAYPGDPDQWSADLNARHPLPEMVARKRQFDANIAALDARVAALDGLGDCARYARMLLKAWRITAATTVATREGGQ